MTYPFLIDLGTESRPTEKTRIILHLNNLDNTQI